MEIRHRYEAAVLAACLLEEAYPRVCHILQHKNFACSQGFGGKITHARIYEAIAAIPAGEPHDLVTAHRSYVKLFGQEPGLGGALATITNAISTGGSLMHHAFSVLQMDITAKLMTELARLRQEATAGGNHAAAGVLQEGWESLREGMDVFTVLAVAPAYFRRVGMDDEAEAVENFESLVKTRVQEIKRVAQVEALGRQLSRVAGGGGPFGTPASRLAKELVHCIVTGRPATPVIRLVDEPSYTPAA